MSKDTGKSRRKTDKDPLAPERAAARRATSADEPAGRITFDERGNAVWEWAQMTGEFGNKRASDRLAKLNNPDLAIADDASAIVEAKPFGLISGYNPYDSVPLGDKKQPRKKDLKKLGEWLTARKQAGRDPKPGK